MGSFFRDMPHGSHGGRPKESNPWNKLFRSCNSHALNHVPHFYVPHFYEIQIENYLCSQSDNYDKAKADKLNKTMHMLNGNMTFAQYKILQINTGSGGWCKNDMLLLCTIGNLDPDVVVISESNYTISIPNDTRRKALFPDYNFHDKMFQNLNLARLTVMIKNKHNYQRQQNF